MNDRLQQGGERDASEAAAHQQDAGGAQGRAGKSDGGFPGGLAEMHEADGRGVFRCLGDGEEDGMCGSAPEVVHDDVDAAGECLLERVLEVLRSGWVQGAEREGNDEVGSERLQLLELCGVAAGDDDARGAEVFGQLHGQPAGGARWLR